VHVANLRKKIGDEPAKPRYVETVRGVGYRFAGR
jgi:DNA-binding response OmpR family regulator